MAKSKKIAFGLIRVSSSAQDLQSQKDALKKIASKNGYTIADEYEGHDFFSEKISGYDEYDYDRASIVQLKQEILVRKPDAIFIWELSRLTRNATKVGKYIQELSLDPKIPMYFADYDLWTISPKTGKIDSDAFLTLLGGAKGVQLERERIKNRTSRGRDAKGEKGYYVGHLKDGYIWEYNDEGEKVIVIDEERRPVIELIYDLYLNKEMSTGEIRDYLIANNIPSTNRYRYEHPTFFKGYKNEYVDRTGNIFLRSEQLWTDASVSCILRDEWYKGIRRYHGEAHQIDPIVSEEVWDACDKRLAQYRMRVSTAQQPYLLTGLLFCGICGRKLHGHADGGYDDMYYCASYEYGKAQKCGLKWVRKQNLDAIIANIIQNRVYEDIETGQRTPFSKFFSVDEAKLKELNERIRAYSSLISHAKDEIEKYEKQISFFIEQQGKYFDQPSMVERYQRQIDDVEKKILIRKDEILNYEVAQDKLKKEKRIRASVKDKLIEVKSLEDYEKLKTLLQTVIDRIDLYNPDRITTVIKISYVNGKIDTAIYCPTRMLKEFIFLSKDRDNISPYLKYNEESKVIEFKGYYYAHRQNFELVFDEEDLDATLAFCKSEGMVVYKDEISVREYIDLRRNDTLNVYTFKDLLPMSEKGIERRNYSREYQKKRNTGKPTFTPFVEKDANYEKISLERKHLYNRKYKILNNKHLSQEEKDKMIFEIMEKLEAFKYQLKYLPNNKKGEALIEKYGKK